MYYAGLAFFGILLLLFGWGWALFVLFLVLLPLAIPYAILEVSLKERERRTT